MISNKAVADGAVSFFLDHFVTARVSKYAYGIVQDIPFDETDIEHLVRSSSRFCDPSGQVCLRNSFSVILPKVLFLFTTHCFHNLHLFRMFKSMRSKCFDAHTGKITPHRMISGMN